MIEARGLTKRYGDKVAVDDLTFTVEPGRVTGSSARTVPGWQLDTKYPYRVKTRSRHSSSSEAQSAVLACLDMRARLPPRARWQGWGLRGRASSPAIQATSNSLDPSAE